MRQMVFPGDEVAEGRVRLGGGVYRDGDKVYSSLIGLLDKKPNYVRVIPITGKYIPKVGDYIIGQVVEQLYSNWDIDLNSPYVGILSSDDFYRRLDPYSTELLEVMPIGTLVYARVREVTPTRKIYLTMRERVARILRGGRVVEITPTKIPRVIGKKMSMINMIRKETGTTIKVGQNGRVWIKGESGKVDIVVKALQKIEREAHLPGLTDSIKDMIIEEREKI
ncbi:MAG: RNA-binding protein [Euryarchaeota archaeon]|nr:RNA-binding protein [Euryarchaeota archaeon]